MLFDDLACRMASVVDAFFAIISLLIVFLHLLQLVNRFYYDIYCDVYYDIPLFWHQKYTLQNHAICANMKSRERSDGRTYMTVKPPLVVSLGRFFHAQRNPQYPFGVCKRYSYHARLLSPFWKFDRCRPPFRHILLTIFIISYSQLMNECSFCFSFIFSLQ